MNFKNLKKLVILAVVPVMLLGSNYVVLAGGVFSRYKKPLPPMTPEERHRAAMNILRGTPRFSASMHIPTQASDGGLMYFYAWNGVVCRENFDAFLRKYRNFADYTTSAKSLPDSIRDENWRTAMCMHENNADTLEFFEESKDTDFSKYLLRINSVRGVIYTIRKSGDLYLVMFYLAANNTDNTNNTEPELIRSCSFVSSDIRNIEYLLLPIDRELLY